MLIVFRNALPAPLTTPDIARDCVNADMGAGEDGGGPGEAEGARSPLDLAGVDGGCSPEDLRVLATGSAGRAILGGPLEAREGCGSVAVIMEAGKATKR